MQIVICYFSVLLACCWIFNAQLLVDLIFFHMIRSNTCIEYTFAKHFSLMNKDILFAKKDWVTSNNDLKFN